MMSTDTQTNLAIDLKSARGSEEAERGRAQRVGGWENDAAMIYSLGIRGMRGAGEGEMPFKEIRLERRSVKAWVWVGGELRGFFEDAFDGGGFGVESWERHNDGTGLRDDGAIQLSTEYSVPYTEYRVQKI